MGSRTGSSYDQGPRGPGEAPIKPSPQGTPRSYKGVAYALIKGKPGGYNASAARERGGNGGWYGPTPDSWVFEGKTYKKEGEIFAIIDERVRATEAAQAEKDRLAALAVQAAQAEQARIAALAAEAAQAEKDRLAAQAAQAEQARIAALAAEVAQAEKDRLAAQAEKDRIAAQAESDRIAAQAAEQARIEAERQRSAEQAKIAALAELDSIPTPSKPSGPRVDALMGQIQSERAALRAKIDAGSVPDFSFLRGKVAALDAAAADDEADRLANAVTTRQGSYKGVNYVLTIKGGSAVQSVDAGKYGNFPSESSAQAAIDQAQAAEADAAAKAKRIQDIAGRIQTLAAQASGIQGGARVAAAKQTFAAEQGRLRDLLANGQEPSLDTLQAALDAIASAKDAEAGDQAAGARVAEKRQGILDAADAALETIAATPAGDADTEKARDRVKAEVASIKAALNAAVSATPSITSLPALTASVASAYAAYQGKQALARAEASRVAQEASLKQASAQKLISGKSEEASDLASAAAQVGRGDDKVEQARADLAAELAAVNAALANPDLHSAAATSMSRARSLLTALQKESSAYQDRARQAAVQAEQETSAARVKAEKDAADARVRVEQEAAAARLKAEQDAAKVIAINNRKDEVSQIVAQASTIPRGDDPVEAARSRVLTEADAISTILASGSDAQTSALRSLLSDLRSTAQSYQVRMKEQEGDAAARQQSSAARIDAANQAIKARREQQARSALDTIAVMERMAASVPKGTPAIEQARSQFAAEAAALKAKAAAGETVDTTFLESRLSALTGRSGGFLAWLLSLLKA